jgi:hypothetical protein
MHTRPQHRANIPMVRSGHRVIKGGSNERVDLLRQFPVLFGDDIARAMRRQADLYSIVDIGPGRMVIHLLRRKRDARHKGKSLGKVLEFELPVERIIFFFPHALMIFWSED